MVSDPSVMKLLSHRCCHVIWAVFCLVTNVSDGGLCRHRQLVKLTVTNFDLAEMTIGD